MDAEHVLVCKHCHGEIVEIERGDDYRLSSCPCGKGRHIFIDGGEIDLEQLRAQGDLRPNDFQILL